MLKYGYKEDPTGTLTDVGELCGELRLAGCNISCGYYNQHTSKEFTRVSELQNCLNFMEEIINTLPSKQYDLEVKYDNYYGYHDPYGLYDDYDFDWKPDITAWDKYDEACKKAEQESPKEIDYESIPCDTCRDMDCMHCKYLNVI